MASGGASVMKRCTVAARWSIRGASTETPCASSAGVTGPIVCGRGDKKTKKGKRFKGSYGKSRPKREQMIERIKDKVEVPRSTPWPLPFKLI
uniref:30S ribosomal protein S31 n=1 Tax=Medicago truncatula TaxID=3880 RepID=I3T870_MEDTR|nr:unknown [Medicago truncatula]